MSDENALVLTRTVHFKSGTYGQLVLPNGLRLSTVERPWVDNHPYDSCIPTGTYTLAPRVSGVVNRSTGGEFKWGWEVTNVPDRTYIMLHPGNWPDDTEGCIAVGMNLRVMRKNEHILGVSDSRKAFSKLMDFLDSGVAWKLKIRDYSTAK